VGIENSREINQAIKIEGNVDDDWIVEDAKKMLAGLKSQ